MIRVKSIFKFEGDIPKLFVFLHDALPETVYFENEDITVEPDSDGFANLMLCYYCYFYKNPKIADDYTRWQKECLESTGK